MAQWFYVFAMSGSQGRLETDPESIGLSGVPLLNLGHRRDDLGQDPKATYHVVRSRLAHGHR